MGKAPLASTVRPDDKYELDISPQFGDTTNAEHLFREQCLIHEIRGYNLLDRT
jgi:hypothetical protein